MESKRLYYIDWLRVLVVLSLIPFHAALTYLRYGTVYIKAPVSGVSALPFLIVSVPLGDFFMTLLFFVSGVASFYSFKKRDGGMYVGERAKKLNAFLQFNEKDILENAGKVTAAIAKEFAESEFEKYRIIQDRLFKSDFDQLTDSIKNDE